MIFHNTTFQVGDQRKVRLLEQKWQGEMVLKDEFLVLYRVSFQRELSIQQVGAQGTEGDVTFRDLRFYVTFQNLRVRRNFQGWELTELQRVLDLLQNQGDPIDKFDALNWKLENYNSFSVKFFYEILFQLGQILVFHLPWSRFLRCQGVPFPAATRGVILTLENFRKRKVVQLSW